MKFKWSKEAKERNADKVIEFDKPFKFEPSKEECDAYSNLLEASINYKKAYEEWLQVMRDSVDEK